MKMLFKAWCILLCLALASCATMDGAEEMANTASHLPPNADNITKLSARWWTYEFQGARILYHD